MRIMNNGLMITAGLPDISMEQETLAEIRKRWPGFSDATRICLSRRNQWAIPVGFSFDSQHDSFRTETITLERFAYSCNVETVTVDVSAMGKVRHKIMIYAADIYEARFGYGPETDVLCYRPFEFRRAVDITESVDNRKPRTYTR